MRETWIKIFTFIGIVSTAGIAAIIVQRGTFVKIYGRIL